MKLVIDIQEEDYNFVTKQVADGITNPLKICIANGTPLPKGHGRLIEAKRLKEVFRRNTGYDYHDLIDIAPTIIEADKESEE